MANSIYPGVDAHLNSFLLQPDGGWESFHANHVVDIQKQLDPALPDNYYAIAEKSLQIGTLRYPDGEPVSTRRTIPDVSVYQRSSAPITPSATEAMPPTLIMPALTIDEDPELTAVNIYKMESGRYPGRLVTRIELMSPWNKPGRDGHDAYLARRRETRQSYVNIVEIDYIHSRRPVIPEIPSYPDRDPNAEPYHIAVTAIRPGELRLYLVGVDGALPRFEVPLASDESSVLDLQAAYHKTLAGARVFSLLADYTQPPVNVDAYTEADQAKIRAIMDQ